MNGRLPRALVASLLIALLSPVAPVLAAVEAPTVSRPDLFRKTLEAARQAVLFYGSYDNPEELRRITEIGYRIAQESNFDKFPFTFYLVDMPEPNAFALPGGQIFLTKGMLDLGLTDDMLAGLLGHEIGHVVLEHGLRMQRKATLLNVLSQALLVGVMVGASQRKSDPVPTDPYNRGDNTGDIIQGAAATGAVVSELLLRSYSREFEDESDDEGQRLAAAAGFDPDGTRQLMEKMGTHMPQSREYGYWRTHPFFEQRVQAADVREDLLKIQEPKSAEPYRIATQSLLLEFMDELKVTEELARLLEEEALVAWPQGPAADAIRLGYLHEQREAVLAGQPMSRDFGRLSSAYERSLSEVRELTPESPLVATLESELGELEVMRDTLYPRFVETFRGDFYETSFLEVFLSNYPGAEEAPEVALALGTAYYRLDRQSEAVEKYLLVLAEAPDTPSGERARQGLRNVASRLGSLSALEQLARQDDDAELRSAARERLDQVAEDFQELANGAAYLKEFPDGRKADVVSARLDSLAEKLYGELILYQSVGDHVKGIERIQKILTYAPGSPAAERLRDRMVLEG